MEKCPKCGQMTAHRNMYTDGLECMGRKCSFIVSAVGNGWYPAPSIPEKKSERQPSKDSSDTYTEHYDVKNVKRELARFKGKSLCDILEYLNENGEWNTAMSSLSLAEDADFWFGLAYILKDAATEFAWEKSQLARKLGQM